jgi:hypothetical protein
MIDSRGEGLADVEQMDAEQMEAEIAALSARMDAAMHRMLVLIRRFDERREWAMDGHKSCAAWLGWRTGLAPGAARERVRVAHALAKLPKTEAALARGELSFSKVRAITRVATPEREERLLDMARVATAYQLERICRGILQGDRETEREADRKAGVPTAPDRYVMCRPMDDGTVQVIAQLLPDEAEAVRQALHRVRAARMREQQTVEEGALPGAPDIPAGSSGRRPYRAMPSMADALVEVASRVLAGDLDAREGPPRSAGDRVDISVVLSRDVLEEGHAAQLEDGTRVPAETFRRLACDAGLVPHLEDAAGQTLDVGRKTRRIPPAIRRALRTRQPTCAFPGCNHRRFLDAHHIEHWIDGGETKLENLIHLCTAHHRLVHEDGFTLEMGADGRPVFRNAKGQLVQLVAPPSPSRGNVPVPEMLTDYGKHADIPIHPEVRFPEWQGDHPDYTLCLQGF